MNKRLKMVQENSQAIENQYIQQIFQLNSATVRRRESDGRRTSVYDG